VDVDRQRRQVRRVPEPGESAKSPSVPGPSALRVAAGAAGAGASFDVRLDLHLVSPSQGFTREPVKHLGQLKSKGSLASCLPTLVLRCKTATEASPLLVERNVRTSIPNAPSEGNAEA
jgi:hypothetical protein